MSLKAGADRVISHTVDPPSAGSQRLVSYLTTLPAPRLYSVDDRVIYEYGTVRVVLSLRLG
jgi:hypothetical protein